MSEFQKIHREYYPHIFTPMQVKKETFKNRLFVAPMHMPFAAGINNLLTSEGKQHFLAFAKGGAAAVHFGESLMDRKNSVAHDTHLNIMDEAAIISYNQYNLHAHIYGAKTSIEFNHDGHFALPKFGDGSLPMSATARIMPGGVEVREMNEDDMEYVSHIHARSANLAKRAGFDMVLMHFGHGWLFGGFLSPVLNERKDKYGGNVENRMRFPLKVLENVRRTVGDDFIIEVRLSTDPDWVQGITIQDVIENVRMIQDYADLVHISTGNRFVPVSRCDMMATHFHRTEGHNIYQAAEVKRTSDIRIPVGAVGGIGTPECAEKALADGDADYILMARSWIADPEWGNKARAGNAEDIRPCLRCQRCFDVALGKRHTSVHNLTEVGDEFPKASRPSTCSVNPLHGDGQCRASFPPVIKKKKVVIIGGGPAGMNAALCASERGHMVTLFEKRNNLGGQISHAKHVWFKKEMESYRAYLEKQVRKSRIELKLGVTATPALVSMEMPDAIIVAVGAEAIIPPIPGVNQAHVLPVLDIFGKEDKLGKSVAIIGGGLTGCETALHLADKGIRAHLVETLDVLAPDGVYTERLHTLHLIEKNAHIDCHVKSTCIEVRGKGILLESGNCEQRFLEADSVILCVGMKSRMTERVQFNELACDVIFVGDCNKVGNVCSATGSGYDAGLRV